MTEKSVDELIADLWQFQSTAISPQCCTQVSESRSSSSIIENEKTETAPQKKKPVIRKNQKCPHNKRVSLCKECGGEYLCQHDRVKRQCKLCSGASMCVHGRRVALCRECGGSALCEHGRQKRQCKNCKSITGLCLTHAQSSLENSNSDHQVCVAMAEQSNFAVIALAVEFAHTEGRSTCAEIVADQVWFWFTHVVIVSLLIRTVRARSTKKFLRVLQRQMDMPTPQTGALLQVVQSGAVSFIV